MRFIALTSPLISGCGTGAGLHTGAAPRVGAAVELRSPRAPEEVRLIHNLRVDRLSSLWGRADFSLEHETKEGDRQWITGDGFLALLEPTHSACLQWSYLDTPMSVFGCNDALLWALDPASPRTMYIARNENVFDECCDASPLLVRPIDLIPLMGLVRIPESATFCRVPATPLSAEEFEWAFELVPASLRVSIVLDAATGLPARVTLRKMPDSSVLGNSILSRHEPITPSDEGPVNERGDWMPHMLVLTIPPAKVQLRIVAHSIARKPPHRANISADLFDFDKVWESFDRPRITVLDAKCARPARPRSR